jgi:hypothetical protein
MKKVFLIFSLFCFVLFSATVAEVANNYIEPAETYILTKIISNGQEYWMVNIEGNDELLIDSTPALLTEKTKITDVLIVRFEEESMIDYRREQVKDFILQFEESQYPHRSTCEQYTGVDKMPCYDRDSCLKACYAVPICSMIKSEPFIYTILDWNNAKNNVDESLIKVYEDLENAKTISDYSKLRNSITSLENDMDEMEKNGLYSVYGFCKDMDISYDSLDYAKSIILDIEEALGSESIVKQKANSIYAFTTERMIFIRERPALYTEIHVKVLDLFKENEEKYKKSKVYDEKVEISLALASAYVDDMLSSKNEGNYKIAIQKGDSYYSTLSQIKIDINALDVKRKEVDYEANKALETYEKSLPVLKNTKYDTNITLIKNEIERVKGIRIVSNELTYYKGRMIEFDEKIKEMVSDCVLNGCEKIENLPLNETEIEPEKNETDIEIPDDLNGTEIPPLFEENSPTTSIIDSVINTISSIINNLFGRISGLLGN